MSSDRTSDEAAGDDPITEGVDPEPSPQTVVYRLMTLHLGGAEPTTVPPAGTERVVIEADVVTIDGLVRWPGCDVDLTARVLEVVGSEPAVLDVSGAPPKPSFDETDRAADGTPGAEGGQGDDGGSVTILVDGIVGPLLIRSNGGAGGNSQGGGNGIRPAAPPAGRDGRFTKTTTFGTPGWNSGGSYGGKVLAPPGIGNAYVAVAYGQPGARGRAGGSAGHTGQPGAGGSAGQVVVRSSDPATAQPSIETSGGKAGEAGPAGLPGPGGPGGAGGRNWLYWYTIFGETYGPTNDGSLAASARQFGVAHRVPTGPTGDQGTVPPQPSAEPGPSTGPIVDHQELGDVGPSIGPDLLELILAGIERDLGNGLDIDDRLRWLLAVTAARNDDVGRRVDEIAAARGPAYQYSS